MIKLLPEITNKYFREENFNFTVSYKNFVYILHVSDDFFEERLEFINEPSNNDKKVEEISNKDETDKLLFNLSLSFENASQEQKINFYLDDKWNKKNFVDRMTKAKNLKNVNFHLLEFIDYITNWKFFKFNINEIRKKNRITNNLELAENGYNLSQVLMNLNSKRSEIFKRIEDHIKLMIPEIDELIFPITDQSETYVSYKGKDKTIDFDINEISDGILFILAIVTSIYLNSSLLVIEEPENFIHPSLLRDVVQLLKNCDNQVIITTHSPYLIDKTDVEDLFLFTKDENNTQIEKIALRDDVGRIKKLLDKEMSLGEAYYGGVLNQ